MFTFKTSRAFAATPEAVFAAFEEPEYLAKWWGPTGFRSTFDVFEFKPGGAWRFTMHGPDGTDYPNECKFIAIETARRVIVKHLSKPHFQLTIDLEPQFGGTLVTWEQAFESAEVAAALKPIVEPANEQNLSRWQEAVATRSEVAASRPILPRDRPDDP